MIEESANIVLRKAGVCVCCGMKKMSVSEVVGGRARPSFYRHKEGWSTCMGNLRSRRSGVQWMFTIESTLWGTGEYGVGCGSHPWQPPGLAEIAPVPW